MTTKRHPELRQVLSQELRMSWKLAKLLYKKSDYRRRDCNIQLRRKVNNILARADAGEEIRIKRYAY